jgi:hypothetical protein
MDQFDESLCHAIDFGGKTAFKIPAKINRRLCSMITIFGDVRQSAAKMLEFFIEIQCYDPIFKIFFFGEFFFFLFARTGERTWDLWISLIFSFHQFTA